jgi:hypothetical protein
MGDKERVIQGQLDRLISNCMNDESLTIDFILETISRLARAELDRRRDTNKAPRDR